MLEIRFHGRGGQGTVVLTILLAKAFFQAGYQVQSFPFFGVERRGAPVEAYLRLSEEKILSRTNVIAPDHIIIQDRTLLGSVNLKGGLKPGGWVLLNAGEMPDDLHYWAGQKLAFVDASRIARKHNLGSRTHPIVNTAMMGAFARMLGIPPMDAITSAIREEVPSDPEQNIAAAQDAFNEIQIVGEIKA